MAIYSNPTDGGFLEKPVMEVKTLRKRPAKMICSDCSPNKPSLGLLFGLIRMA